MRTMADLVALDLPSQWRRLVSAIWTWLPATSLYVELPTQSFTQVCQVLAQEGYHAVPEPHFVTVIRTWGDFGVFVQDPHRSEPVFWTKADVLLLAEQWPIVLGFLPPALMRSTCLLAERPPETYGDFGVRFRREDCLVMALTDLNEAAWCIKRQMHVTLSLLDVARAERTQQLEQAIWGTFYEIQDDLVSRYGDNSYQRPPPVLKPTQWPRPP